MGNLSAAIAMSAFLILCICLRGLGILLKFYYLAVGKYPRTEKPISPLADAVSIVISIGILVWASILLS